MDEQQEEYRMEVCSLFDNEQQKENNSLYVCMQSNSLNKPTM